MPDYLRGHKIERIDDYFVYADTKQPTADEYINKPCGNCGLPFTKEGHDGCLGTLPGNIMNACCGHGQNEEAYIQYEDGSTIDGQKAITEINRLKQEADDV